MRADLMNEGYALGLCAAEATKTGTGDFRALAVKNVQRQLVKKGNLRDVRAVTLALEALGDPAAAKPLAQALATPGLGGWSRTKVEDLSPLGGYGLNNEMDRCLRELAYARALLACGDYEGRGRAVYEAYARAAAPWPSTPTPFFGSTTRSATSSDMI